MSKITDDPEFTAEMLAMMGKELKQARQHIKDLESFKEAYKANDVLSLGEEDRLRDFRERTDAAEEALEIMHNHVQNVNKENQRLRQEVRNVKSELMVKEDDLEMHSSDLRREYREQGVCARTNDQDDVQKNQAAELEAALEKYYSKYVVCKKAKSALEKEIESLKSINGTLEIKHKGMVAETECLQKENGRLVSEKMSIENQLKISKAQIDSLQSDYVPMVNYRTLIPGIEAIGNSVALTPPTSQPVCFSGADLGAYLQTDPRTAKYSKSFIYSPNLLQFPDGTGRSALWLRPLFDGRSLTWTTRPPLGKNFTVFYPMNGRILYAGQYTVVQVSPCSPSDPSYLITNQDPQDANVIESLAFVAQISGDPDGTRTIDLKNLYVGSALQVGVVGLKFQSFDNHLHDILGQRFKASLPIERRVELPNSNTVNTPLVGKKKKTRTSNDNDRAKSVKRKKM